MTKLVMPRSDSLGYLKHLGVKAWSEEPKKPKATACCQGGGRASKEEKHRRIGKDEEAEDYNSSTIAEKE